MTMIEIREIKSKQRIHRGHKWGGVSPDGVFNARIEPGKSIQIFGAYTNHIHGPQLFNRTFRIGDEAEYDSWNLTYTGKIMKITPKTVVVDRRGTGEHARSMDLYEFAHRNWDFNAEKIAAENAETSQCI
jgi:hypothetical protein